MSVSFFVPGIPVAQGRPRFKAIRMGAFSRIQVYDPEKSEEWKEHVRCVVRAIPGITPYARKVPLVMALKFVLKRPKRLPKTVEYPITKPDLSNYVKAIEDALGSKRAKRKKGVVVQPSRPGLIYADDSQIVDLHPTKRYGTRPGVYITVKEMP